MFLVNDISRTGEDDYGDYEEGGSEYYYPTLDGVSGNAGSSYNFYNPGYGANYHPARDDKCVFFL